MRKLVCFLFLLLLPVGFEAQSTIPDRQLYQFKVLSKSLKEVPKEYRVNHCDRYIEVGSVYNSARRVSHPLFMSSIPKYSWRLKVHDMYIPRDITLYAPYNWLVMAGDTLLLYGVVDINNVFVLEGRKYAR